MTPAPDLFALGQRALRGFLHELRAYGIEADPGLQLRRGQGLLCYYDVADRHVYLSMPDLTAPEGKLHLLMFRDILGASSDDEVLRFLALFVPFLVAHELAHHLRHRDATFGDNRWREEQVANQLAVALVKHHLPPEERAFARRLLEGAIARMARRRADGSATADSYHDVAQALNVSGHLTDGDLRTIGLLQTLFATSSADLLKATGQLHSRLQRRAGLIESINQEYASDPFRYIDYQVCWMHVAMAGDETHYVEKFAREHLRRGPELLPAVPVAAGSATLAAIQACYQAYLDTAPLSETARRYFYKRYRSLLLAQLRVKHCETLLETWDEAGIDTLSYLTEMAPPALRDLFPHRIADHLPAGLRLPSDLPTATDARLWEHVVRQAPDAGAASTLARLALLERHDLFRSLPAEPLLELSHLFSRKKLAVGDTLVWEGERGDDVFIVIEGSMEVLVANRSLEVLGPGEVFGEMAWLTNDTRTATVRATTPAECLVLPGAALRLLAFTHPTLLTEMASVVARRLAPRGRRHG